LGDRLDGAEEPTMSAPATPKDPTKRRGKQPTPKASRASRRHVSAEPARIVVSGKSDVQPSAQADDPASALDAPPPASAYRDGLVAAYTQSYEQFSLDRVVADPGLNARLGEACLRLGLPGDRRTWNLALFRMRKAGLLAHLPAPRRTEFTWEDCDPYLFASEIAWRHLIDEGHESLDSILCDPALAAEFDTIAGRWAPGFTPLEYRWAALKLRKKAKAVRARAKLLADAALGRAHVLDAARKFPQKPGVYVILGAPHGALYAGETRDLRARLQFIAEETREPWRALSKSLAARIFPTDSTCETRLGYQRRLVVEHRPALNLIDGKVA
jgi:site-specific DNA-methyltransferase (adenine-specific)